MPGGIFPYFSRFKPNYLTCGEQLRQWLKLMMKTLYMVCYAQVDWYTNTSHKNCRQTMCNVVHSVRPHVEKTSMYYVVAFSCSPVSAKGVQRRWRWYVDNSSSNMKFTITQCLTKMNCSHRCDACHIFRIVTIFIACKQLVLPNSRASWQWDKHSDYLPCGCCAPSTLAHVFTLSLQWYPHSQTQSLMKGSINRILCPLT